MTYKPGDVILVRFPFSDLESSKKRPALVLAQVNLTAKVGLVSLAMVTSKIDGLKISGDCQVKDWASAGLINPSLVRLSKTATVETDIVEKKIGQLKESDFKSVKTAFRRHYAAWI